MKQYMGCNDITVIYRHLHNLNFVGQRGILCEVEKLSNFFTIIFLKAAVFKCL